MFLTALSPLSRVLVLPSGSAATAEDPAAIATIQSAATYSDQPIKYLFKTEGAGGQVRVHLHAKRAAHFTHWNKKIHLEWKTLINVNITKPLNKTKKSRSWWY